jgi:pimeloyl-ACP methyl ester carboxylesterase
LADAMARLQQNNPTLAPHSVEALVRRGTEEVEGGVRFLHDVMLRVPTAHRFTEEQIATFFTGIKCPVLAVIAKHGNDPLHEFVQRRKDNVADLTLHMLDSGFHHVHLDSPELVAPLVSPFLLS